MRDGNRSTRTVHYRQWPCVLWLRYGKRVGFWPPGRFPWALDLWKLRIIFRPFQAMRLPGAQTQRC